MHVSNSHNSSNNNNKSEMEPFQDISYILQSELPQLKRNLADNALNLLKVADFCQNNYLNVPNCHKSKVLEETKSYAIQSLASVAYQINTIATSFLQLLDFQSNQFNELEFSLNSLTEETNVHKEKVARREIGTLTTNKIIGRQPLFIKPNNPEKLVRYVRKSLDYSLLDDIGHGVRLNRQENKSRHLIYNNGLSTMDTQRSNGAPLTQPPPPPKSANVSLSKATGSLIYQRSMQPPPPPPLVPPEYASRQELAAQNQNLYSASQYQQQQHSYQHRAPEDNYGTIRQQHQNTHPSILLQQGIMSGNRNHPHLLYNDKITNPVTPLHLSYVSENVYATRHNGILNNTVIMHQPQYNPQILVNASNPCDILHQSSAIRSRSQPPSVIGSIRLTSGMDSYDPTQATSVVTNGNNESYLPQFIPKAPSHFFEACATLPRKQRGYGRGKSGDDFDWAPAEYLEKVIAIYDYESQREDELTFQENTIIFVITKNDDGWYEGIMQPGIRGLFPGNYVEHLLD